MKDFCQVIPWYTKGFRIATCDPKPVLIQWFDIRRREDAEKLKTKLNRAAKRWMKRQAEAGGRRP